MIPPDEIKPHQTSQPNPLNTVGSEMAVLIRDFDWSKTALGPRESWPQSLRTTVSIILDSFFGMYIAWGDDYIQLYNDGFRPILGSTKHPQALGKSSRETFAESWHMIEPLFQNVMKGQSTGSVDWMVPLNRHGYLEECYFTYSYSPIREDSGDIGGILVVVTETTDRVLSERRLRTLREMGTHVQEKLTVKSTLRAAVETLKDNPFDIAFALLYVLETGQFELVNQTDLNGLAAPPFIAYDDQSQWPLKKVVETNQPFIMEDVESRFGVFSAGAWPEPITKAIAMPIVLVGQEQVYAVFICGISPRRALDETYQAFLTMVARQMTSAATNAHAYESERQQVNAMATFQNVLASITDPLYALDPDWNFVYVNKRLQDTWHKSREELIGKNLRDVFPPKTIILKQLYDLLELAAAEQRPVTRELYSEATRVWWVFSIYPAQSGLAVYLQDITGRKEAEAMRERLELVLDHLDGGFFILDRQKRFIYLNHDSAELAYRVTGKMEDQLIGMTLEESMSGIFHPHFYDELNRSIQFQKPTIFEVYVELFSMWMEYRIYPSLDDVAVFTRDITHHKQEEAERAHLDAELEIERQRFANILATVPGVIWENEHIDEQEEMKLVFISAYVETMLGYTVEEALAEPHFWAKIFHPQDAEKTTEAFNKVRKSRGSGVINFRAVHKSGRVIDVQALMITILQDDKPVGKRGVMMDVTERQRLINAQARYATMLRRSNEELQQFAYVASHDLQEPLRMVTSYLQLLESRYSEKLDDDAHEFIAFAVDGAARMKALINDLLVYSRVDGAEKDFEEFNVQLSLNKALSDLALKIEDSHAVITYDPMPSVKADRVQITQLFQNLISNALKFQRGENVPQVHIGVERQETEWQFSVRDNGIGIGPQYVSRIFVIFQRLNRKDEYPGTGIGLAICKKVVERHGGRIWVESKLGEGTTFYFTIPA
ncbi:MAG: PAS domain S-box protein [Anaerolineaceae bacterium]|nr:PAS domain S-box protein [Anaerolineaceae bacterium]